MNTAPWLGVLLVATLLVASMAMLSTSLSQRLFSPEQARKCLHVGVGLVTLSFPWLFATTAPVIVLAALALGWFELVRNCKPVNRRFAAVLHRVARAGRGESYFVAGAVGTFLIAGGDKLAFCLPMAILAIADAGAALAGQAVGRRADNEPPRGKTWVGSTAFFGLALACSLAALALAGWPPGPSCALALTLALATTLLEAASGRGMDNLLVPVVAASLLRLAAPIMGGTA